MIVNIKCKLFMVLLLTLLVVSACGEKPEEEKLQDQNTDVEVEVSQEDDEESKDEKQKVEFENPGANAPEDQGDLDVWFKGDVSLDGRNLTVDGVTNLLPKSKLYFLIDGVESNIIGGNTVAFVDDNGKFLYENKLPEKFEGLFNLEIKFEPAIQNNDIKENYGETGENLEGDFVRTYANTQKEMDYKKAAVRIEIAQQDGQKSAAINPPVWEPPSDYGETDIWIEPRITKDDRYIYVDAKSNFLEGTQVKSRASIPNYITSGFIGIAYANPDGSFRLVFENPESEERIKDLTDYEIILEALVKNSASTVVSTTYGKAGEHFTGKLVEQNGDNKVILYHMKVKVD